MRIVRTRRRAALIGMAAAVVVLVAGTSIAVAGAATKSDDAKATTNHAVATHAAADEAAAKLFGIAVKLMSDQQFRADVTELGASISPSLMQWRDSYGEDPTSATAIGALRKLGEQWEPSVDKLLGKYGIDLDAIHRAAKKTSAKMLALMRDDGFRADLWRIRDAREAESDAWWDTYANEPTTDEALSAMAKIEQKYREQMSELLEQNGMDMSQCMRDLVSGIADAIETPAP